MRSQHPVLILLVLTGFITVSFITNLLGPIFPELISDFGIGLMLAGFFPFAFFIAYGVMSVPAGLLVERFGERAMMLFAYSLSALSCGLFVLLPHFAVAMLSLFCLGLAMSVLQVVMNPLLRFAAGSEHYSFMAVLGQLLFGLAAAITPVIYQQLTALPSDAWLYPLLLWLPATMPWLSLYLLFAVICLLMLVWLWFLPFPKHTATEAAAEPESAHHMLQSQWLLLKNRTVQKFFVAIFCYVALEQGIANSMAVYLQQVHQVDAASTGASAVGQFWLNMTIGCVLGLLLLKLFDCRFILLIFGTVSLLLLVLGLSGDKPLALWCLPLLGGSLSVMWSIIFALALNSMPGQHGAVAGILCSGIIGGAFASPLLGLLAEQLDSIRLAMLLLFVPLAYIISIVFWARPLVNNQNWWASRQRQPAAGLEDVA
ncbi:MFS transporter [Rheinheimera riviphila]|uniref:MFS transporter n=1 Tax=Rheinheimera riviphila TaxID=1834037 RepID=A0A437QM89_9GAMM|nr:MFS transporter [Rheinheimera riviphila]RVU35648.1 MFS transporter [Rheinheimera riviphila]